MALQDAVGEQDQALAWVHAAGRGLEDAFGVAGAEWRMGGALDCFELAVDADEIRGRMAAVDPGQRGGGRALSRDEGGVRRAARGLAGLPVPGFLPPVTEWAEAISHPAIMDATKAKAELGWQPRYTGLEALHYRERARLGQGSPIVGRGA